MVLAADVSDESTVERAIDEAGAAGDLRVLVTAAGTNRPGPAAGYACENWDLLFDINVRATFLACRAFGRRILDRGGEGAIVTMSSQMGSVSYPGRVADCATKHAVNGMTRALAVEWARQGIRVNASTSMAAGQPGRPGPRWTGGRLRAQLAWSPR